MLNKIITQNDKLLKIFKTIDKIKNSDIPVLIQGETGTGKELFADQIQKTSKRSKNKFVKVNCAALPENLIESELFGHTKGAFTGANYTKSGLFPHADHGTVFLDEIGDLNNKAQTKLLRIAQDGTFRKVGGNETEKTDVRLICATNKSLFESTFRKDLYYRLAVVVLTIPPLRERKDDILFLAEHFLDVYADALELHRVNLSGKAKEKLFDYNWPGNVRELENTIHQALLLAEKEITEHDIILGAQELKCSNAMTTFNLAENEALLIRMALKESRGVQNKACRLLGVSARVLNYKLKVHGMR